MSQFITTPRVANRLRSILFHVPFYSIEGLARLAKDTGFSKSTISRLANQKSSPSYLLTAAIVEALSKRSGFPISAQEIFSSSGRYPTSSVCRVMGCKGCLPPEAWDEATDTLRPQWRLAQRAVFA